MVDSPTYQSLIQGVDPQVLLRLIELEERERLKERARNNYLDYVDYVHEGVFKRTRHAVVVCNAIQEALNESERIMSKVDKGEPLTDDEGVVVLLISMPPQHGKSLVVAETLPSYFNCRHPNKNSLIISYNQNSARKFGRRNRYKIERFANELFNEQLDDSNSSVEEFGLKGRTGIIKSVGINGTITGHMGNLVIIDDPYKNGREANSPTIRRSIQDTLEDSVLTRLHPGTLLIVVHTRWHEDDLIAYLSNFYGSRARVLSIPAECEDEATDPLGRKLGEFLWEEHHGRQYYLDRKRNSRVWSALYQQRPAPQEGAMFRKSSFRFYAKEKFFIPGTNKFDFSKFKYLVMSWDCAFEGNATSDYVVGHVWGYSDGNYYLIDRFRKQVDFVDSHAHIYAFIKKYPAVKTILIERKANGSAIINTLERRNGVKGIKGISPTESKERRAENVAYLVNDGRVFLPEDDPTIDDFIEEFGNFPYGKNDDEVDAFTQAVGYIEEKIHNKSKVRF